MAWLLVKDGIIKNAIAISPEAAQTYTPPDGMELVYTDEWFNIGWEWDGTKPVEPLEENPSP
jgi:hypothetical protein